MKLIPLTQNKFAMVDDEDYDALNAHKWHAIKGWNTWYATRRAKVTEDGHSVSMHRSITPYVVVDHRDGNGLNNQRANLREGVEGNARSMIKHRDSSNRYKGVYLRQEPGRRTPSWRTTVRANGRIVFKKQFGSELEAALAYDEAARKWHGEFCAVNFPRIGERSALTGEIYMGEPALVDGEVVR